MWTKLMVVFVTVIGLMQAAPIDKTETVSFVELFSDDNLPVPCPLCALAMDKFLDFCKEFDGISVPRVSDFLMKCALIGEEELKENDRKVGCSSESLVLRSRARVWNRKLKCLKIYQSLSTYYSPFDPCTSIRTIVQFAPMAICQSNPVRCVPPPVDDEYDFPPPWGRNMSLPNEFPPLRCPQYVAELEKECQNIKGKDFYARSSLEEFCAGKYGTNVHQVSGCETVRQKMNAIDSMMDLCGSLQARPIAVNYDTFCNETLALPVKESVPDAGYAAYLERVKLFKEAWEMSRKPFQDPSLLPIRYPAGDRVLNLTTVEAPPAVKVEAIKM